VSRPYPGNVRDLRSLVLRIVHRYVGTGVVTVGDIPDAERPAPPAPAGGWRSAELDACLGRALELGARPGDIAAAAKELAAARG
jgi:transcriptional regulator of acetoin/glycerol metabolism